MTIFSKSLLLLTNLIVIQGHNSYQRKKMQDYKYRAYRKEIKLSESCDRHKSIFLNNLKTCYFNFSFDIALSKSKLGICKRFYFLL